MRLTAADLYSQGIIEKMICEPEGYSEQTLYRVTDILDKEITDFLEEYRNYSEEVLLEKRYERFGSSEMLCRGRTGEAPAI